MFWDVVELKINKDNLKSVSSEVKNNFNNMWDQVYKDSKNFTLGTIVDGWGNGNPESNKAFYEELFKTFNKKENCAKCKCSNGECKSEKRKPDTFEYEPLFKPTTEFKDGNLIVRTEICSLSKEDLKISGDDSNTLTIESNAKANRQIKRSIEIPEKYDISSASAKCLNGLLEITIPEKKTKTKIINID